MKTEYYIGLDCGGTRTRGVVADEQMRILARARAGPGNPLSAGMTVAFSSYRSVIRRLLDQTRLNRADITALGIGAAGAGRQAERLRLEQALQKLVPRARIMVESDGMIALLGATLGKPGIIVIAGTGLFCPRDGRRRKNLPGRRLGADPGRRRRRGHPGARGHPGNAARRRWPGTRDHSSARNPGPLSCPHAG